MVSEEKTSFAAHQEQKERHFNAMYAIKKARLELEKEKVELLRQLMESQTARTKENSVVQKTKSNLVKMCAHV